MPWDKIAHIMLITVVICALLYIFNPFPAILEFASNNETGLSLFFAMLALGIIPTLIDEWHL